MAAEADAGPGGNSLGGPGAPGAVPRESGAGVVPPGSPCSARRRCGWSAGGCWLAIPVLWGVTFLTFVVMNLLPGNAAQELLGANATPAEVRALEIKLHLNEPFWIRYWHWLSGVLHGRPRCLAHQRAAGDIDPGPAAAGELRADALRLLHLGLLAVPVAAAAAHRPGGWADRLSMMVSMAGLSIAPYVLALLLIFIFAVRLQVLPAIGFVPLGQSVAGNIRSLTLPATRHRAPAGVLLHPAAAGGHGRADAGRGLRGHGPGQGRGAVAGADPPRPAQLMFGLLTVIGLNLGTLIGALVIIEQIFALPGIGQVLLQSINNRDIVVVEAVVLVFALIVVLANLLTDLLYAVLDPRIRYGRPAA